jgi:hypothetical protein
MVVMQILKKENKHRASSPFLVYLVVLNRVITCQNIKISPHMIKRLILFNN